MARIVPARTARELLTRVLPFAPAVDGTALVLAPNLPAELVADVRLLQSGLRALLTGRVWWGSSTDAPARVRALSPDEPIPRGVGLVCAEGDASWDRLPPAARGDRPHLFTAAVPRQARGSFPALKEPRPLREQSGG